MSNYLSFDLYLRRGDASNQFKLNMQGTFKAPITTICGASGAGKSTLLALLAGLLQPMHGFICLNNDTLTDCAQDIFTPPHLRQVGIMWQDGQLFPHLSVRDNLLYGYHLKAPAQRRFSAESVIDLLEIGKLLDQQPRHLSGGERQRVALGRTLLAMPTLLLLDEPLNALNFSLKQPILQFLKEIPQCFDIPLVYVTHQLDEAKMLGAETWMCADGKLSQL